MYSVLVTQPHVEKLARELAPVPKRRLYDFPIDRVRRVKVPSGKLFYLYLVLAQPQSFGTLRRGLELGESTIARTLNRLGENGYLNQDRRFLYWITEPKEGK